VAVALQESRVRGVGYLNLKALAHYSSCSVRWLRARLTDPIAPLPCYRIGGKLLVKPEEFDVWMVRYRAVSRAELGQVVDELIAQITTPGQAPLTMPPA